MTSNFNTEQPKPIDMDFYLYEGEPSKVLARGLKSARDMIGSWICYKLILHSF